MGVLGFLQKNLQDYQMNYFKSQLIDWESLVNYISDKDKPSFFKSRKYICGEYDSVKKEYITESYHAPYDWEYAKKEYTDKNQEERRNHAKKYSLAERNFFLVNHESKELYTINKKLIDKFTFSYDGNYLVCKYHDIRKAITFEKFARCKMHDRHHTITIWFNLEKNCVKAFSDNTVYKNGGDCGSWHDSSNEDFDKNFVDDEDQPWIEEAKIQKKLAKSLSKNKETLYKSGYGNIIIKQDKKKWIILWAIEDDDSTEEEDFRLINSTEIIKDYAYNDIKNFPKGGKFSSEIDAYNFIVSILGELNEI